MNRLSNQELSITFVINYYSITKSFKFEPNPITSNLVFGEYDLIRYYSKYPTIYPIKSLTKILRILVNKQE